MIESEYHQLTVNNPSAVVALLLEKDHEILKLQQHLINAQNARFGKKSEKLSSAAQYPLFPIEELELQAQEEPKDQITVPEHIRSSKRKRREIPEGTPVRRIEHPAAETSCRCCGNELIQIREEITKILDYKPAQFELEEHVRPVMSCKHCKTKAPITSPLPAGIQLIEKSAVGVGLLSHVLISKYQDHLPLYRLEGMFARLGFDIARQRMCDWLGNLAELMHPLYQVLKSELLKQDYLQADETTIKIQDGEEAGKCHTGYFWSILAPPPLNLVLFHYSDSRASEVPKTLLSGFSGVLQTDLYAGYNPVYVPESTRRAGCWAHVRRKFKEIEKLAPKAEWNKTLELIAKLYNLEPKKPNSAEQLRVHRQKHSALILKRLHEHLTNWSAKALPRSEVQKPIRYALSQWEALSLFVDDPKIQLDNNLIENQMRPIALGRKNWLFAGSHEGAMRAAIFFSLINSCRLLKVNTWRYFNDILPRLESTPKEQLLNLLPNRWAPISN